MKNKIFIDVKELDMTDLENLCITLMNVRSKEGLLVNLKPWDVFQDWFMEYFPKPLRGKVDV